MIDSLGNGKTTHKNGDKAFLAKQAWMGVFPQWCLLGVLLTLALHFPLVHAAKLQSKKTQVTDKAKRYKIDIDKPLLTDNGKAFNTAVAQLIAMQIAQFKRSIDESSPMPKPLDAENQLNIDHQVIYQGQGLYSVLFKVSMYIRGQAHPDLTLHAINYAEKGDKVYAMSDIFTSDSNYLEYLSRYCIRQLKQKKYDQNWIEQGADPSTDNFTRWSFDDKGLIVYFNPYQVAAYVDGPQKVNIPYPALLPLFNSHSELYNLLVKPKVAAA